ncbi:MAG: adenylate/guanylate cyclase domain-containing protein [Candidatus Tumulicola sp.]
MATQVESGPPPSARPTGTVTFLFSDIEGSTARWEHDREAMEPALARHDALMYAALEARDAYVFKTVGDEFCAAFATAPDAIAAALDAQRALAAADFAAVDGLRVRMALHTGSAAERDGDYFGPTVNRVARLLAIGHGGQVLVSGVTTDLVQGALPGQTSLRDLGEHRLKDLARPEQVYQLLSPDLAADFPPLLSLGILPNNLPLQLTTFVGREAEIGAIISLIEKYRLVTLVGSGGVGKTRLSLQVAANLLDGSGDGVWFIELAPIINGEYIPSTVALALGLTLAPKGNPVENLVRALKGKHALLVFDNCEHLVEPAARVISAILHACPTVKVLASSRQGLGVAGEAVYRVPSLVLPAKDEAHLSAADTLRYESVALFAERAAAASATFSLTDENAPIVADICRRLDGIPLAIELAAARVRMLSPKQLRDRLDERFRLLTGGSRDVMPRQQTLRALIDWSHDLLDEFERVLFRRLAIFVDGFTLEGAAAVGSGEEPDELDAFDVLASLVDKSLVLAEARGDALRYRLLESTRAYAAEKLEDAGERDLVAGCHLRYLRDHFAELRERVERTTRAADFVAALQTELDDVRAALDGALTRSNAIGGGELLANIYGSWQAIGLDAEGMARCEAYLAALPADQSRLRARLSTALAGMLSQSLHTLRAFELAKQAVEHARASGDDSSLAWALNMYAFTATSLHRLGDAERALNETEAIPATSASLRIDLLIQRALLSQNRGDLDTAARVLEELRKKSRSLGNPRGEQIAMINLTTVEYARGQTQRAIAITREVLSAVRSGADKSLLGILLNNLAGYLAATGDLPGVAAAAREAIGIRAAREPDHAHVAVAIDHLALFFALRGDRVRAATLESYADAALERHGRPRDVAETATRERLAALLQEALAPDELARLTAEGAALTPEAAIALALEEREIGME